MQKTTKHIVYLLLLIIALMRTASLNGQVRRDSLMAQLATVAGEERLHTIDRLLVYTIYNDLDTSFYYASTLLKEAKESNNELYESLAYSWLTVYHYFRGEYYEAENCINKAIEIQELIHDSLNLGNSYVNKVLIYTETGSYEQAIEYAFKALELFMSINRIHGIIVSNGNIGILYNKLKDYEKANKYLKKTADLMFRNKEFSNLGELYENIGLSYNYLNKNDSAVIYFHKAITEYSANNDLKGTATAYLNLANTYAYYLNDYASAFLYYDLALKNSEGTFDGLQTRIYRNKGKTYALSGDRKNAIIQLNKAVDVLQEDNNPEEQMNNYYELFTVYKSSNDMTKALDYFEKYHLIKDSLNISKARITIANLEARHENENNLLKIEKLNSKRYSDRKIKRFLLSGIVLLAFIVILLIQKKEKTRLRRELLNAENEKLEKDLQFKSRQLTSQTLSMMQKNSMLDNILNTLREMKCIKKDSKQTINKIIRELKQSINSEEDWAKFRHYFEEINPGFYSKLIKINDKILPSELKLSALIKLDFSIKETASLLNITPDSVKSTRHVLRIKLGLTSGDNIHEFLNNL